MVVTEKVTAGILGLGFSVLLFLFLRYVVELVVKLW